MPQSQPTPLAPGRLAPWEVETKRHKNRKPPSTQEYTNTIQESLRSAPPLGIDPKVSLSPLYSVKRF